MWVRCVVCAGGREAGERERERERERESGGAFSPRGVSEAAWSAEERAVIAVTGRTHARRATGLWARPEGQLRGLDQGGVELPWKTLFFPFDRSFLFVYSCVSVKCL